MNQADLRCPLCQHPLDPSACKSCPIGSNCPIVCCPECSYTTVDATRSKLGNLALRLFGSPDPRSGPAAPIPLAEIPQGATVRVVSIEPGSTARPLQLRAYGLAPGRRILVLQQDPVTVVRADHTELALEGDLAQQVLVEFADPTHPTFP